MNTIASTANRSIIGINASIDFDLFESDLEKIMSYVSVDFGIRD
jgi:hypothetical protein